MDKEALKGYLSSYLQQKGLPLRKAFSCLSPDHHDRHPSMQYYEKGQVVHCFSCGATYDLFDLIAMDYGLCDFPQQLEKACSLFGVVMPQREKEKQLKKEPAQGKTAALCVRAVSHKGEELKVLRQTASEDLSYFLSRGITPESCEKYGLFVAQSRAYFPLWQAGECTGWCGRAVSDSVTPRYKNSAGAMGIWNQDAVGDDTPFLYITEGIIDAILLTQMGKTALSLCGSQNTKKLLTLCGERVRQLAACTVVLCGDPDKAGQQMNVTLQKGLCEMGLTAAVLPLTQGDIGEYYLTQKESLAQMLDRLEQGQTGDSSQYETKERSHQWDAFFTETKKRSCTQITTGFDGVDTLLDGGIYPGLYVLGAISSVGKTSLFLQMADHICREQRDVLYFSLEQSRFELMAKSLSRRSAELSGKDLKKAFTARDCLRGELEEKKEGSQLLEKSMKSLMESRYGLFIKEGIGDIGTEEIRESVREHIALRGHAPVVMVDYLQIMKPFDPRSTDKQNTDRAVVELKRISRDFDIPVLAVSSFNRDNYRTQVSMEAFKESGAVEYASDVLLGLQLTGTGEKGFDVNTAKLREPREVELVVLKNRNGIPFGKVKLQYRAKYSLFYQQEK